MTRTQNPIAMHPQKNTRQTKISLPENIETGAGNIETGAGNIETGAGNIETGAENIETGAGNIVLNPLRMVKLSAFL